MPVLFWIIVSLLLIFPASICPLMYWAYRQKLGYKRRDITNLMGRGNTLTLYRQTYGKCPDEADERTGPPRPEEIEAIVTPLFDSQYNARNYVYPFAMVTVIMFAVAIIGVLRTGLPLPFFPPELSAVIARLPAACLSAIAGAFVWGLYDMVKRFRSIDLTPSSIHYLWLRLLLAPCLGYFVAIPAKESTAVVTAFALMTVPISDIIDYVQSQARKNLALSAAQPAEKPNLEHLQGMSAATRDMLDDEAITSAAQLAMIDPFKLLLRTNLEWATILDLIDQAILFNYIGEKLAELHPMGIRGAIELADLRHLLDSDNQVAQALGEARAQIVADRLEQTLISAKSLIETVEEDTRVNLIWDLWGSSGSTQREKPETKKPETGNATLGTLNSEPGTLNPEP